MRTKIVTAAAALALMGAGALTVPAAYADQERPAPGDTVDLQKQLSDGLAPAQSIAEIVDPTASEALDTARRVFDGKATTRDPSATLALRDLWMKKSELTGAARREAEAMLARPTDGSSDDQGFGYTVPEAAPLCNARLCLHYVPTGTDAPPSPEWAAQSLAVMDSVWTSEVDGMGYRPPVGDKGKDGGPQFDVYLKDLGSASLYGFCAGEKRAKKRTASGYCVLDNDFSTAQFPTNTPEGNLRVTAAHEFFHAIQYAYDYAEDPWMLEATATWMEERYATDVNDNLQYLPAGQLYRPDLPLDLFSRSGGQQYGNWIFWEYLSTNYGTKVVKKAWELAGTLKKDGKRNSLGALQKILKRKGGLTKVYATYAAGNLTPASTYPEGAAYQAPETVRGYKVLKKGKSKRFSAKVKHLSSASYAYAPGKGTSGKKAKLALRVNGPLKRTSPAVSVVVYYLDGKQKVKLVKLNPRGDGSIKVPFSSSKVAGVSVTLANVSTRYRCNQRTLLSCAGRPLDDKARFSVVGRAVKR